MTAESTPKAAPIIGLDAIRFLAASMVMWFHLAFGVWSARSTAYNFSGGAVHLEALGPLANWGWIGVEIFFVLSGFVIAFSAQGKSASAFARSRFLRLYPAAWACSVIVALIVVALYFTGKAPFNGASLAVAFLHSMALWPFAPWLDGVFWTLGVEMAFYLAIFLLLRFSGFARIATLLSIIGLVSATANLADGLGVPIPIRARWSELALLPHGVYFAIGGFLWLNSVRPLRAVEWGLFSIFVGGGVTRLSAGRSTWLSRL